MRSSELNERGRRHDDVVAEDVSHDQRAHPAVLGGHGLLGGVLGIPGRERPVRTERLVAGGGADDVRSGRDDEAVAVSVCHPYAPDDAVGAGHPK